MDYQKKSSFEWAYINDRIEIVKILLERWPKLIKIKDFEYKTCFVLACQNNSIKTILYLLEIYPDIV